MYKSKCEKLNIVIYWYLGLYNNGDDIRFLEIHLIYLYRKSIKKIVHRIII